VRRNSWGTAIAFLSGMVGVAGECLHSLASRAGFRYRGRGKDTQFPPYGNEPPPVHLYYAEKVLAIHDDLPKYSDYPIELGGSGETLRHR
jgi:hypothetical protein